LRECSTLRAFVAASDHACSLKILFYFGMYWLCLGIAKKLRLNGTGPDL
jgi:hypothetical protein